MVRPRSRPVFQVSPHSEVVFEILVLSLTGGDGDGGCIRSIRQREGKVYRSRSFGIAR